MKPVVIASLRTLAACAVAARIEARHNYEDAAAAYRACLTAHPADTNACESSRLSMEAQGKLYEDLSLNADVGLPSAVCGALRGD
jgi:hypothetical protein